MLFLKSKTTLHPIRATHIESTIQDSNDERTKGKMYRRQNNFRRRRSIARNVFDGREMDFVLQQ